MAKYHVKKDGTPGLCKAQEGNCPLGDSSQHFSSKAEAQEYADKKNEIAARNKEIYDNLNKDDFRDTQLDSIESGMEKGLDISKFADPRFEMGQMGDDKI